MTIKNIFYSSLFAALLHDYCSAASNTEAPQPPKSVTVAVPLVIGLSKQRFMRKATIALRRFELIHPCREHENSGLQCKTRGYRMLEPEVESQIPLTATIDSDAFDAFIDQCIQAITEQDKDYTYFYLYDGYFREKDGSNFIENMITTYRSQPTDGELASVVASKERVIQKPLSEDVSPQPKETKKDAHAPSLWERCKKYFTGISKGKFIKGYLKS